MAAATSSKGRPRLTCVAQRAAHDDTHLPPPRDRDAFAKIRGFVYQADLTILRWLDLQEGQHLELERGEDIDLVGRALSAEDAAETWRVLEQVKHREKNLTLREPAAVEALANALEHLRESGGVDLRFCYTEARNAVCKMRPHQLTLAG